MHFENVIDVIVGHATEFPADYHRLRVGGLILAAVLCLIGITILLSKTNMPSTL